MGSAWATSTSRKPGSRQLCQTRCQLARERSVGAAYQRTSSQPLSRGGNDLGVSFVVPGCCQPTVGYVLSDIAVLDATRFAYVTLTSASGPQRSALHPTSFSTTVRKRPRSFSSAERLNASVEALGADKYLVTTRSSRRPTKPSLPSRRCSTCRATLSPTVSLAARLFTTDSVSTFHYHPRRRHLGRVHTRSRRPTRRTPASSSTGSAFAADGHRSRRRRGGAFADTDGDGDLDFSRHHPRRHRKGRAAVLRLEGGTYELTDATLKVTNATVFADIGSDTTSPLFKGSFTLDRATGVASAVSSGALGGGATPFTIAGLTVIYRGLTVQNDGAAFKASFQLPTLFGSTARRHRPQFAQCAADQCHGARAGRIRDSDRGARHGLVRPVRGRGQEHQGQIRRCAERARVLGRAQGHVGYRRRLGALAGCDDVALTFKDFKIKDGLYRLRRASYPRKNGRSGRSSSRTSSSASRSTTAW